MVTSEGNISGRGPCPGRSMANTCLYPLFLKCSNCSRQMRALSAEPCRKISGCFITSSFQNTLSSFLCSVGNDRCSLLIFAAYAEVSNYDTLKQHCDCLNRGCGGRFVLQC